MKKNTKKTNENLLRNLVRSEIKRLMEAEEEANAEETGTEEEPTEEEPDQEEEEGLSSDFEQAYNLFIRKLRSSSESVSASDVVEMAGNFIDSFASSNEEKLNILKTIKSNIVR